MKKINLCALCFTFYFLSGPVHCEETQSPKDFLEATLLNVSVDGYNSDDVALSCDELRFSSYIGPSRSLSTTTIPLRQVDVKERSSGSIEFLCIAGGGCIKKESTAGNLWTRNEQEVDGLPAEGLTASVLKAISIFQVQCGGKVKRPF